MAAMICLRVSRRLKRRRTLAMGLTEEEGVGRSSVRLDLVGSGNLMPAVFILTAQDRCALAVGRGREWWLRLVEPLPNTAGGVE